MSLRRSSTGKPLAYKQIQCNCWLAQPLRWYWLSGALSHWQDACGVLVKFSSHSGCPLSFLQFTGVCNPDYNSRLSRAGQDNYELIFVFSTPPNTFCSPTGQSRRRRATLASVFQCVLLKSEFCHRYIAPVLPNVTNKAKVVVVYGLSAIRRCGKHTTLENSFCF